MALAARMSTTTPAQQQDALRERLRAWARAPHVGLLDVREASRQQQRLRLARAVHIPHTEIKGRQYELPPPKVPFAVLADAAEEADYVRELFCVSDVFIADEELFAEARALGLVDGGEGGVTGSGLTHKPAHLWQPASFVADALPKALASFEGRDEVRVVDFGCGVGRDCVFAALQDERVRVVAVDSSAVAMERLAALGGVHGVAGRVTGLQLDIRKQSPEAALAEAEAALGGPVDIVVGVRFLHRELLQALPARLRPGACVLWSHFALPCGTSLADFKAAHGHPSKQRDVLEAGELARIFEGWTVLVERVDTLLDGRPLACLLTRK